jgi:hypothetical protein
MFLTCLAMLDLDFLYNPGLMTVKVEPNSDVLKAAPLELVKGRTRLYRDSDGIANSGRVDEVRDGAFEFCRKPFGVIDRLGCAFSHLLVVEARLDSR